jgi:glycosyltransferase involved in cell wall biosynthesis
MKSVCVILQGHYETDIRVRRKAEALVAAGYSVDVLALRSSHSASKTCSVGGVCLHTVSLGKKRGSLARYAFEYLAFLLWAFCKLSSLMRSRSYAVIDVNTLPDFLVFAAVYAKKRGAKVVLDMHEITPEFYMSKYEIKESSWLIRFLKRVERASFRYADHVLTINEPIHDLLVSRGLSRSKSTVIMNAVDEKLFASSTASTASSNSGPQPNGFVMMYHGTLTRIYGLDIALEAFAAAHHSMPGAQFWILGSGPEKVALQEQARKAGLASKVRFIGSVLPEEIPQWLKCCHIGVLATRRDVFLDFSFSNKLSEYIIMDKGVICSRLRTIRHYFGEEALAFFEPNNSSDLARQMICLYGDAELRGRLAERAKVEYTPIRWELMRDRYLKLIEALAGKP